MKQNLTELVFILDKSGSMSGLESDTIGGYNSLIEKQKKIKGKALVTTVLFDDKYKLIHGRVDLEKIKKLTNKEYFVGGCTALLDAVGSTIELIKNSHSKLNKNEVPNKVIFAITTDGLENASKEFDLNKVKNLISSQQKKGWEFLFLGSDLDVIKQAGRMGIDRRSTILYEKTSRGVSKSYNDISCCMAKMREPEESNNLKKDLDKYIKENKK